MDVNPYEAPRENISPRATQTARISLASAFSLLFLSPLVFELVMIPFAPKTGVNWFGTLSLMLVLWVMLLVPGGLLAVLGIYLVPGRFSLGVLVMWFAYPPVLCVSAFLNG